MNKTKSEINKTYRNSAKAKETTREYRKRPETKLKIRNNKLKYRYGISLDDYNNMFTEQNGCCLICLKHQSVLNKALVVDHCHSTGKVRGLLCSTCNFALGFLEDDIPSINRALVYLKKNNK